ncbi:hypothetical protein E2C01_048691 [Portunus trituberculatus]|uniref:Uncharacterized protein n=1 Tax=Portunus trituberculatus TaxID=210409 RepID=A0A5B7GB80_PORTR|nr:hypothetical protein [Portunus trituberculatus]
MKRFGYGNPPFCHNDGEEKHAYTHAPLLPTHPRLPATHTPTPPAASHSAIHIHINSSSTPVPSYSSFCFAITIVFHSAYVKHPHLHSQPWYTTPTTPATPRHCSHTHSHPPSLITASLSFPTYLATHYTQNS